MTWTNGRSVRLGSLFSRRNETGRPDMPMLSVYRDFGVIPRDGRDDNYNKPGEDLGAYRVVHSRDLVLNKMKTWQGSLGISGHDGIVSPAYFVARPLTDDNPGFLHHLLRSRPLIAEYGARSKGIRPSQWDLPWDEFRDITVELPPRTTQHTIADYLDRETSRIDALIVAKRRMVELLGERFWSRVNRQIDRHATSYLPLRRFLTRITDGPFGSSLMSSDYSESGARVVRLGNIGRGHFRNDDTVFISMEYFQSLFRHRVRDGDLLIAGLGDVNNHVGRACVARQLGLAIVKADCYCASVNSARGSAEFLALYLSSPLGAKNVAIAARGTTRSRINLDIARAIEVPVMPLSAQSEIVSTAASIRRQGENHSRMLQLQIKLIGERRQALITAAVTGQLDIPEAA